MQSDTYETNPFKEDFKLKKIIIKLPVVENVNFPFYRLFPFVIRMIKLSTTRTL